MRTSVVCCLLFCLQCFAQTENEIINNYIERFIENTEDEVDIQQIASDLLLYLETPLDVNKADASQLFQVPFFTNFQALEIIEHRKTFGNFISPYELQVLPSFDAVLLRQISPFITLSTHPLSNKKIKDIWQDGEHQWMTLWETNQPKNKGIILRDTLTDLSKNYYTGSPIYANFRYRFDYKRHVSYGINMEKDAGEPFYNSTSRQGFDYYSYYFALRDVGKIKALHLGDFQANFGQGLTLSTGLAFGKSSIITNSKRNFGGFGAYRSLRENAYLRGGAVAFDFSNLSTGVFASAKKIDGNAVVSSIPNDNGLSEIQSVTNLQEDGGLHRTASEIADKDVLQDLQVGVYAEWKLNRGKIGAINYLRKLSSPLQPTLRPYNSFTFTGDQYYKNGMYYDLVFGNVNLYGEISHSSHQHALAQVHGALFSLGRNIDLSCVYRKYDNEFIGLQSTGFGESSNTSNENGLYVGFETKLSKSVKVLGYYDMFTFPWLRFKTNAPSSGDDFWGEFQYKPNRVFKVYYRYRTETKQGNKAGSPTAQLVYQTTQRHRIHLGYTISKGIELRNRAEWSIFTENGNKSYGSLLYQDIIYKPFGSKLQLSGRVAYSVIDQFENRIFSFEQTPLYDYPLFTHGFSGLRYYVLARYKVGRKLDIWLRYAHTKHDVPLNSLENNYNIGSGLDAIEGNHKRTITLQVRYKIK